MPVCKNFCKDCFSGRAICKAHEGIFDTWNCDKRPCESCNEKIKMETPSHVLARVFCFPYQTKNLLMKNLAKECQLPLRHLMMERVL